MSKAAFSALFGVLAAPALAYHPPDPLRAGEPDPRAAWREVLVAVEELKARRTSGSKEVGQLFRDGRRDEAEASLDELLEGTRSEQLAGARAAYAASRAAAARSEIDLDRASLRAARAAAASAGRDWPPPTLGPRPASPHRPDP
mgnify:CR=1 FL=1